MRITDFECRSNDKNTVYRNELFIVVSKWGFYKGDYYLIVKRGEGFSTNFVEYKTLGKAKRSADILCKKEQQKIEDILLGDGDAD